MTPATRTPPHHNTLTCYLDYRCRLPECVTRMREYERCRRQAKAAGTWQPLIDAEPVRQHLGRLAAAGITAFRVAAITGLPDRTIRGITERQLRGGRRAGLRQRTTPEIARLILAIDPNPAAAGKADATPSLRRIQALAAAGWPLLHIAQRTGIAYTTLRGVSRQPLILRSTAAAITLAYEQLRNRPPTRNGVSVLQARKARARAASHRWPTAAYWDHPDHPIGDPGFQPDYGITRAQQIAEDAHWLMTIGGLSKEQAAARLRRSCSYVNAALREHPQGEQAAAA